MQTETVNFKKEHDFGGIISGTFQFLKQEYKMLLRMILLYAGPFILFQIIANAMFQDNMLDFQSKIMYGGNPLDFFKEFLNYFLILTFFSTLTYTMIISITNSYIGIYVEKGKDNFTLQDVWQKAQSNFFKVLGANILVAIIVGIGTVFCFVPGIYLFVSLSLIYIIMINENISIGDAFSKSFALTKVQWWWTLLLIIVVYAMVGIIAMIISIPSAVINSSSALNFSGEISETSKMINIIFNALLTLVSAILSVIPIIALSFQYFNIKAIKNKTSLLRNLCKAKDI